MNAVETLNCLNPVKHKCLNQMKKIKYLTYIATITVVTSIQTTITITKLPKWKNLKLNKNLKAKTNPLNNQSIKEIL